MVPSAHQESARTRRGVSSRNAENCISRVCIRARPLARSSARPCSAGFLSASDALIRKYSE